MDEPQIELRMKDGQADYYYGDKLISRFELLALAAQAEDKEAAWDILEKASILYHGRDDYTFNILYGCVAMEITRNFYKSEFYHQGLFIENVPKLFEGKAEVVNRKSDGKNIPDVWLDFSGELVPVEVKLRVFDKKALQQLLRYIKAYECNKGVAVANSCDVELPDNITFISFSEFQ